MKQAESNEVLSHQSTGRTMCERTDRFPTNIEDQSLKIQHLVLYFVRADGAQPFEVSHRPMTLQLGQTGGGKL